MHDGTYIYVLLLKSYSLQITEQPQRQWFKKYFRYELPFISWPTSGI